MRAHLISTEDESLEARIEIKGTQLNVMDHFSPVPAHGEIDIEFDAMLNDDGSREGFLSSNPEKRPVLNTSRVGGIVHSAASFRYSPSLSTVDYPKSVKCWTRMIIA